MPGRRCVVQGCSNTSQQSLGISLHSSPLAKSVRNAWVRFVRTHRANFNPQGSLRFVVCSEHFQPQSFEKALHVDGFKRFLRPGSIPTIWTKDKTQLGSSSARTARRRRKVRIYSRGAMHTCHYSVYIYLIMQGRFYYQQ